MLIGNLLKAELLVRTSDDPPAFLPSRALETLKLKDLVVSIRQAGESSYLRPDNLPQVDVIDSLYTDIENAINTTLGERTLRDLSLPGIDPTSSN